MKDKKEEVKGRNVKRCAYGRYENASKQPITITDMDGMYWCEIAFGMGDVFFSKGAVAVSASDAPELLRDPGVEIIDSLYKREIRNSNGATAVKTICAFKDKDTFDRAIAGIDDSDAWACEEEQALILSDEATDDERMKEKMVKAACTVAAIIIDNNQDRVMYDLTARQALLLKRCAEILSDFHDNNREGQIRKVCEFMLAEGEIITCNKYVNDVHNE